MNNIQKFPEIKDHSNKESEWFTTKDAAEYLRTSTQGILNLVSAGKIPYYKMGKRNMYRRDELRALLLSNKRGLADEL